MFPLAYPVLMLVGATAMAVFEYSLGRADGHRSPEVDGVSEDRSRMAEAILSGLPVTTFGQAGAGARCGEACAVCLGAFEPDSRIRVTACGHVFCNECLERQLHHTPGASWSQCSLCRRSLMLMLVGATAMAVFEYSLGRADGHRSPEVDGVSEDRSRMAEAILSGLPVTTFGQAGAGARCGEACAVCLGAFEPDSRIRVTACGHVFCNECLERQLHHTPGASWSQCSLCRRSLST